MKKRRIFGILLSLALVLGLMPGMSLTAHAEEIPQGTPVDSLPSVEGAYYLTQNVTISESWVVTSNITLDLNGYGIFFNGSSGSVINIEGGGSLTLNDSSPSRIHYITLSNYRGNSIAESGTESISDGNGTVQVAGGFITGGNAPQNGENYDGGGGVRIHNGTFTLNRGTIIGNYAEFGAGGVSLRNLAGSGPSIFNMYGGEVSYNKATYGGGIYLDTLSGDPDANNTYTLNIAGGTIRKNKAEIGGGGVALHGHNQTTVDIAISGGLITDNQGGSAGGVRCYDINAIKLSGSPIVTGNKDTDNNVSNIAFGGTDGTDWAKLFSIEDTLDPSARIGVRSDTSVNEGVFTSGLDGKGSITNFLSDDPNYAVAQTENGEAKLVQATYVTPATSPTIIEQPEDLSLTYGYTDGSLAVTATAATDTTYDDLTYQWYSNTTASNEGGTAIAENGTSAAYIIPTGKPVGTTEYYYCVVTATRSDNNQTASATSSVATVTVNAPVLYAVTVGDIANGSVEADPTSAAEGEQITLTITPDAGYELSDLSVTDANDEPVDVENNTFIMPDSDVTVTATFVLPPVNYIDENGDTKERNSYTLLTDQTTWTPGWYVASGEVNFDTSTRVTVSGEAHLILVDGATLNIPKGINVSNGNSLTIYAQSDVEGTMGALTINGVGYSNAGIGGDRGQNGGTITINGGNVTANGGEYGAGIGGAFDGAGGTITINGGVVTANGGSNATGIGGGRNGTGGEITINGGTVEATGGEYGAGIGGGGFGAGDTITINGGVVTATGGSSATGLGGGYMGAGGTITINGGVVTATGGEYGAGIGGGYNRVGGEITINGGTVEATGGQYAAGIGGGEYCAGGTIAINGGDVTAIGGSDAAGIGNGYGTSDDNSDDNNVTIGDGVSVMAGDDENSATDVTATFATTHNQLWVHTTYTAPLTAPQFATAALELGGVLNLRFYVDYPANWDGADDKVTFTVSGKGARTIDVAYANRGTDTNGTYFACPVYAYEMNDKITATYYHGSEGVATQNYTVYQNLNHLVTNATENAQALARATMNYGHYIQPYLAGLNGWTVGTDHAAMPAYGSISADSNPAGSYGHTWNTRTEAVASASYYLTLNDTTTLNVLVKLNSAPTGDVTATADGKTVEPVDAGGNSYLISLPGIPANGLHLPYAFTLSVGGTKVFDLRISGLSYVNLVYANGNPTDVEKQALTALYNYAIAANNYAAN